MRLASGVAWRTDRIVSEQASGRGWPPQCAGTERSTLISEITADLTRFGRSRCPDPVAKRTPELRRAPDGARSSHRSAQTRHPTRSPITASPFFHPSPAPSHHTTSRSQWATTNSTPSHVATRSASSPPGQSPGCPAAAATRARMRRRPRTPPP